MKHFRGGGGEGGAPAIKGNKGSPAETTLTLNCKRRPEAEAEAEAEAAAH